MAYLVQWIPVCTLIQTLRLAHIMPYYTIDVCYCKTTKCRKKNTQGFLGSLQISCRFDFPRKLLLLSVTCNVFANNLDIEEVLGDGASTSGLRTGTVP